jgi:hypothetical protein
VSIAVFLSVNDNLYGGPTPHSAGLGEDETGTGTSFPEGYLQRSYRLVALFIDREAGLLRWAPVLAFALLGVWLLLRERQGRLAAAIPALRREERAVTLCALVCAAQLLVAAFLAPTMFGFAFPGRHLIAVLPLAVPLVGFALRRFPRTGFALALLTVAGSIWTYADIRWGDGSWIGARPDAPWGPLEAAFPVFESGATVSFAVAGALGAAALTALVAAVSGPRWKALRGAP